MAQNSLNPDLASWNDRFSVDGYLFGKEPNAFLQSEVHRLKPGGTILCVADGEGRNGVWLAQQGFKVHAIDGSEVALEKSKKLARERNVTICDSLANLEQGNGGIFLEHADVDSWSWPIEEYDAVIAIFIQFASAAKRPVLFDNISGALKSGGVLLLEGYATRQLKFGTGGPSNIEQLYTTGLLTISFPKMRIDALAEYDQELVEGDGHKGMSALIDMVATKI